MRSSFKNTVTISIECLVATHTMRDFGLRILGMMFCVLLVLPMLVREVMAVSILLEDSVVDSVQAPAPVADISKRRDPFNPIKKPKSLSSTPKKTKQKSPKISLSPISTLQYPQWKLLGIIQGRYGRLAVIQTLSGERIFVEPGPEPIRAGWIITTINDTEVHLKHASSAERGKSVSEPKTFILSFPTVGKSS